MTLQSPSPALHAADCGIWDIPQTADVDVLVTGLRLDERSALYLTEVAPLYHSLARVLAQLSGILLLAMTAHRFALPLDHAAWSDATIRLSEANARLKTFAVPPSASAHFRAIEGLASHLAGAAANIEAAAAPLPGPPRRHGLQAALGRLHAAQKLLVATAMPDANITPVDLSHACCNCGAAQGPAQRKT